MVAFAWQAPTKDDPWIADGAVAPSRRGGSRPSDHRADGDGGAHDQAAKAMGFWADSDPAPVADGSPAAAPDPRGQTVSLGGETHVVGRGDSLWSLARRVYGNGKYWTKIKDANPGKVHGAQQIIRDGDELVIPELEVPTLEAMRGLEKNTERLRDMAAKMSDDDMAGFVDKLSEREREKYAGLIQKTEMMRVTGMTPDELAEDQKQWLEDEAKAKGVSVGELIKQRVASSGYGGDDPVQWKKLKPADKAEYHRKFKEMVKRIKAGAPPEVQRIIARAEKSGGGFRWDPEEVEANHAFAYTQGDWSLHCGQRFIDVAFDDVSIVNANIMHEMGGHNVYGNETGFDIQSGAMDRLSKEEREKAESGGHSVFSSYGYMESEAYAELYEYGHDTPKNPTDHPFDKDPGGNDVTDAKHPKRADDVLHQLESIKAAFSPTAAKAVVRGLALRVRMDENITPEAKAKFMQVMSDVFGAGGP